MLGFIKKQVHKSCFHKQNKTAKLNTIKGSNILFKEDVNLQLALDNFALRDGC